MTILFLNQIITPKLSDKIARIMNDSTIENIGFYKIFTDGIWYYTSFHFKLYIQNIFEGSLAFAIFKMKIGIIKHSIHKLLSLKILELI